MNRIDSLRNHMKEHNISAVVIPTADMHLSEYISEHYKLREYLSGFTGSAGTLVVTENEAGLWTDGRYYIQAEKELSGSSVNLYRASEKNCVKIHEYLKQRLAPSDMVGVDGRFFSKKYLDEFIVKLSGIQVNTDYDPSQIWQNRPPEPEDKAFVLEEKYCGENVSSKISAVREKMQAEGFTHYLVSLPECIMWFLNIRGNDVRHTPVMLSYLLVTQKTITLYARREKLTDKVSNYLWAHNIEVADYEDIYTDIAMISQNSYLAADFSLVNYSLISKVACAKKDIRDFIFDLKCIKNNTEIENIKNAYIKENVALAKSFYEIYNSDNLDECDVSDIIEKHRKAYNEYFSPSFDTIAAFGENAAMMHYSPAKETCAKIGESGLLLIDTGGQYYEGTTDTTRTLAKGILTDKQRENLTLVLKGHIKLATAIFPAGTRCSEIDALARVPLWKKGLDYRCSTGHGVGYMLGVHEGPQRLSSACNEVLVPNMTVTDEPGVYMQGEYGIRIENHLCVREYRETAYGKFLCFEVLNFCPLGTEALEVNLLSADEIDWINEYNTKCRKLLAPHLTKEEAQWLTAYTKTI